MSKVKVKTTLGDTIVCTYVETAKYRDSCLKIVFAYLFCNFSLSASAENDLSYDYPNIPLIEIYTQDMEEPSCQKINPPSGCFGTGITDNVYVQGNMKIWINHKVVYSSYDIVDDEYGMKLKIRGNTTGANLSQHPYKIKLKKKADLFFSENSSMANKEWVLLSIAVWNTKFTSNTTDLSPFLGASVSMCLGTKWTPRYRFVNLVMNGTYRGCYVLTEAVNRSEGRIDITKSGFIIEYDAYWWKPKEEYFKTEHCHQAMAFTFKYPEDEDITDSVKTLYREYMDEVEQSIYDAQTEADDYIDYTSFARWLLIHDILGTIDAAGSNMFLFKESMNPHDYTESLLEMGPTWDYDSCFGANDDELSTIHNLDIFYFNELMRKPLFNAEYIHLWQEVKDKLYDEVSSYFNILLTKEGQAIDESIKKSRRLYRQPYVSLTSQCAETLKLLKHRLQCLDYLINTKDFIPSPKASQQEIKGPCYDMTGMPVQGATKARFYKKGRNKIIINVTFTQ